MDIQLAIFIACIVSAGYNCYKGSVIKIFYWLALSLLTATVLLYAKLLEIQNVVTTISRQ